MVRKLCLVIGLVLLAAIAYLLTKGAGSAAVQTILPPLIGVLMLLALCAFVIVKYPAFIILVVAGWLIMWAIAVPSVGQRFAAATARIPPLWLMIIGLVLAIGAYIACSLEERSKSEAKE